MALVESFLVIGAGILFLGFAGNGWGPVLIVTNPNANRRTR